MRIVRTNAWAELEGAPEDFLDRLARHLAVPLEKANRKLRTKPQPGNRFGGIFSHEGVRYGSLLHDRRVLAGLAYHVEALAAHYGLPCEVYDARVVPAPPTRPGGAGAGWGSVSGTWRPYQDAVHQRLAASPVGIVDCPPRGGKTLMAVRIVDAIGLPTLYVAPSVAIVRQTYETFRRFYPDDHLAVLDGESRGADRDITKPVVISTIASALRQDAEWYKTRQVLIVDERHHDGADQYHLLSQRLTEAYYRYHFTGTNFRTGEDQLAMEAVCSQVLCKITLADLVPEYLAPPRVFFVPVRAKRLPVLDFKAAYEAGVVNHEKRNALVVEFAKSLAASDTPTLVLTRRRAHADQLGEMIPGAAVAKGGEGALTQRTVRNFLDGRCRVLVGTTVLGEGVDLPNAGALVYASGGADSVTLIQAYFRPLTAHPGKTVGRIYDFRDSHHRILARHSNRRIDHARRYLGDCVLVPR